MKSLLVTLISLLCILSLSTAARIRTSTDYKSAYVYWQECPDACHCDYFSISAYDTESRTVNVTSGQVSIDDPLPYLYIYHQTYNSCDLTYNYRYTSQYQPVTTFTIARNSQSARLTLTAANNVTLTDGSLATTNLRWGDAVSGGNCNCRQVDNSIGGFSQRIRSDSRWSYAEVTGWLKIGSTKYIVPDNTRGSISESGQKVISIDY